MFGVITLRDVLAHWGDIRREWGSRGVVWCLVAALSHRRTTFVQVALRLKES
jgi:hypothetical protein